jgi:hypothetical protein
MHDLTRNHEIITTTNTLGWSFLKELAEETVRQLEREAIDEDDDVKGNNLRREAKAARKFLNNFLNTVEEMRNPVAVTETTYFYELSD